MSALLAATNAAFTWRDALGWLTVPLMLMLLVNWLAWIFGWGRFKRRDPGSFAGTAAPGSAAPVAESKLRFVLGDFFAAIITEFRHLLALVLVLVFAVSMAAAMYPGVASGDSEKLVQGVQAVAAALGGLLGSIIGYYFGEAGARNTVPTVGQNPMIQGSTVTPEVREARTPTQFGGPGSL